MVPSAHMDCWHTLQSAEPSSLTKVETNPGVFTMQAVCSVVPEAMIFSAHAASICVAGALSFSSSLASSGTAPTAITSSIGGDFSRERTFLIPKAPRC
jgi:hypothetical protein